MSEKESTLEKQLLMKKKNGGLLMDDETIQKADQFCEEYKNFLNRAKTEREAVQYIVERAEHKGFTPFQPGVKYMPGDKVYFANRGKSLILAVMGQEPYHIAFYALHKNHSLSLRSQMR